jgi:hypothetical protein
MNEPVALRYDFDGYGYQYIDSGSGSDWQTRIKNTEPLYTHPPMRELSDDEIKHFTLRFFNIHPDAEFSDDFWIKLEELIIFAKHLKKTSEK